MFTKICLAICDMLFSFYGWLYRYSKARDMEDVAYYCIEQREDILDNISTLKGLS